MNERDTLSASVKKLNRDVAKLETFKKTLLQSLQDDDEKDDNDTAKLSSSTSPADSLNIKRTDMHSSSRASSLQSTADLATMPSSLPEDEVPYESEAKSVNQRAFSTTPSRLTPHLTPTGSPRRGSAAESPLQQSASESPRWQSTSEVRSSLSSSQSTSQHTTAPNSPPQPGTFPARTPRVDGKEFFRQARNRLSYEQFSCFLGIIKELNAHRQTKEETLRKAEEIFGSENKDLYAAFDGLLNRHLPA
ncbi:hypothetical protein KP509_02G115300 [Ceratopteris richardii]|nr:hypothetical protein KP509_02G115300 [Ceratopteris richardii]